MIRPALPPVNIIRLADGDVRIDLSDRGAVVVKSEYGMLRIEAANHITGTTTRATIESPRDNYEINYDKKLEQWVCREHIQADRMDFYGYGSSPEEALADVSKSHESLSKMDTMGSEEEAHV